MKGMPPIFRDSHLENTFAIRKLRINRMNLNQNQDQNIIESSKVTGVIFDVFSFLF